MGYNIKKIGKSLEDIEKVCNFASIFEKIYLRRYVTTRMTFLRKS